MNIVLGKIREVALSQSYLPPSASKCNTFLKHSVKHATDNKLVSLQLKGDRRWKQFVAGRIVPPSTRGEVILRIQHDGWRHLDHRTGAGGKTTTARTLAAALKARGWRPMLLERLVLGDFGYAPMRVGFWLLHTYGLRTNYRRRRDRPWTGFNVHLAAAFCARQRR